MKVIPRITVYNILDSGLSGECSILVYQKYLSVNFIQHYYGSNISFAWYFIKVIFKFSIFLLKSEQNYWKFKYAVNKIIM